MSQMNNFHNFLLYVEAEIFPKEEVKVPPSWGNRDNNSSTDAMRQFVLGIVAELHNVEIV